MQNILVIIIVAFAAIYLGRVVYQKITGAKKSDCDGCSGNCNNCDSY